MRSVLSISLPAEMVASIQERAKELGISVSLLMKRMWERQSTFITEEELLEDCRIAEKEYRKGKCKVLRTKKDIEKFFRSL